MTDPTINSFCHFLEELEKNLRIMDSLVEKESEILVRMHILSGTMSKICQNWINQLEHRK